MLRLRRDTIWSKRRAQSFHEDNEAGSIIHQRTVESEASDTPGRHSPHASRQGCTEINHIRNSPDFEESGMDTFRREIELVTHKECVVPVIALVLGKDGSEAPREEESAAARGCAKMDSTCKGKEETENEGFSSTPLEVEFCEVTTPTSEFVDDAFAICAEAGNSPWGLERNCYGQPNDAGRINTLKKDPA
ncbi:uncharacterized protein MONOS_12416 [Monocercomonoides exilis]|uniref:uncharacterized protein n=1 Tax=Monocercomonoides exilis TaxID=2049356 RepID=UPI00355A9A99|nr:hypothetical protein MONOS_12416 [Monocercomonoides exilis]|eukprot:MONOS_12416.1-p1 / transcript=MONOS_12416.1 / gene=MONOS_12416 / organism=Monocercomonoides_exilis_PA203 / gene_product=unspecified product / transcript_product=unspecified product / location=Mono_scaffold00687:963-1535(-) / protein_length=191 / sequence_SO=supercontig / SO=protein_coding / is_pseudo=false